MSTATKSSKSKTISRGTNGPPTPRGFPRDYLGLVRLYRLRPIRNAEEYGRTSDMIARMTGFDLNDEQADYLGVLVAILAAWRRQTQKRPSPAAILKAIMEEHDMTQADMAKLMGISQPLVSRTLAGEREISKPSIRRLSERFSLDPAALLSE